MFTRLLTLVQMRRSTAFLLRRSDDRLLDDIGLSRADLDAMHLGLPAARVTGPMGPAPFLGRSLPA